MINKRKLHSSLLLCFCCWLISFVNCSNNRILKGLKTIVDTASENDLSDEYLIERLSRILEEDEGFRMVHQLNQSMQHFDLENFIDGSGELIESEEEQPAFHANLSIITFTIVSYVFL